MLSRRQLNLVVESQNVLSVFKRKGFQYFIQLDFRDISVLFGQNKDISVRISQVMVVLDEVLANDWHSG